jgi:hypothetical protein
MPELPERELQENTVRVLTALIAPPAYFWSAAIGAAKLTPQQAAALSRAGVKRGLPDLMFLHDGKLRAIELKKAGSGPRGGGGGSLSRTRIVRTRRGSPRILEGQEDVFPKLEAAGMTIEIARSVEEVLDQLQRWNIPLRGRINGN